MEAPANSSDIQLASQPAWKLPWLTPWVCRSFFVILLLFGFLSHWRYLTHNCPIDLSGDEAHYWDWSRNLDICYYSKGPLVAWLIRASCALLGTDSMPAVRLPALVLAVGTSILTYWLTRRLFSSDRIALGAVLLNHLVPIFVAGSVLMTIDAPFFFFWALATCFAAKAIFDNQNWPWIAMGLAIGFGFLAKFTMLAWLIGLLIFLLLDRPSRHHLRSRWLWLGIATALLFSIPIVIWNSQHQWVSFRHVSGTVGGRGESGNPILGFLEFIGGQFGALGPALAVILVAAIIFALKQSRQQNEQSRATSYLILIGLPIFLIVSAMSLWTKGGQPNWPAPAYFTLMILAAFFLSTRLQSTKTWRRWRIWFWPTAIFGIVITPIAHNTEIVYPAIDRIGSLFRKKPIVPRQWDPTFRLRGWQELGDAITAELRKLPPNSLVLCEDYQITSQAAFYVAGQPKTFYVGSWFRDPKRRSRQSQYDIWPDRQLDQPSLVGRDAIYFGHEPPRDFLAAFEKVEKLPEIDIARRGVSIRTFRLWRCIGFKGMQRPPNTLKF